MSLFLLDVRLSTKYVGGMDIGNNRQEVLKDYLLISGSL